MKFRVHDRVLLSVLSTYGWAPHRGRWRLGRVEEVRPSGVVTASDDSCSVHYFSAREAAEGKRIRLFVPPGK
jgi:hypothetical protein